VQGAGVRENHPMDLGRMAEVHAEHGKGIGAGDEARTRDMQLGRLPLYQLSYSRTPAAMLPDESPQCGRRGPFAYHRPR
jgi:hypothetical protein